MKAPVTMRQIAERAGVSMGTVSHVINETATVRPKLRERVLEAIRAMGYQPSALAQGLRKNRTNMLGVVIPDITNPFFPGVVRGVEDVAYKRSFRGSVVRSRITLLSYRRTIDHTGGWRGYREPPPSLCVGCGPRGLP